VAKAAWAAVELPPSFEPVVLNRLLGVLLAGGPLPADGGLVGLLGIGGVPAVLLAAWWAGTRVGRRVGRQACRRAGEQPERAVRVGDD